MNITFTNIKGQHIDVEYNTALRKPLFNTSWSVCMKGPIYIFKFNATIHHKER